MSQRKKRQQQHHLHKSLIPREMRADAINYSAVHNDFTILFTRLIKMALSTG